MDKQKIKNFWKPIELKKRVRLRISLVAYNHYGLQKASKSIISLINQIESKIKLLWYNNLFNKLGIYNQDINSVEALKESPYLNIFKINGPIRLPVKKRYYSILRSPHVDKSSQEQYEIRIHKWILDVYIQKEYYNYLYFLKNISLPPGIKINLTINKII